MAPGVERDPGLSVLALYDSALPQVYGYLLSRCGEQALAEDLTAETFLAAIDAARRPGGADLNVRWLIGVARHKLVDHWRRLERERRGLRAVAEDDEPVADPLADHVDALLAREVLAEIGGHHRAALTLRYVDGLPVTDVAQILDRTVHATEALLVRARRAFRKSYEEKGGRCDD